MNEFLYKILNGNRRKNVNNLNRWINSEDY